MILSLLLRAALGCLVGALTAVGIWLVWELIRTGTDRTAEQLWELGPLSDGFRLSTEWLTRTGALPAGILGLIAAPYFGPILGGWLWKLLGYLWGPFPGSWFSYLGTLAVGFLAGFPGYALRIRRYPANQQ